jgi:branched-chain amino acid transport system substrate-binding protein
MISKVAPRIAGALFALAVGFAAQSAAAQQAQPAQQQVRFGMFTPLTGASSVVGLDMRRGVELALERINAGYDVPLQNGMTRKIGPGLLGQPVRLIVEDDESRPPAAMDAVRKLVNVDRVAVVLGEYSSGRTLPTGQFTNENKVIHISIGANSPTLREIGPYFFNAIGLASAQGPQLISLAQSEIKAKTVATLFPNNPYGVGVEIATCEAAAKAGVQCVSKVRYEEQKTDYRPELRQLTAPNPDAVIFFAYGADAALILRQAFELGLDAGKKWIGTEVSNWSSDLTAAPQVGEGIRGIEHDVSGPFYEMQYASAYQAKYREKPTTAFGAFGYDAAMIAALAIADANSTNSDMIRASLMKVSQTYKGITGNLAFDKDGMRISQEYGNFIFTKGELKPYTATK